MLERSNLDGPADESSDVQPSPANDANGATRRGKRLSRSDLGLLSLITVAFVTLSVLANIPLKVQSVARETFGTKTVFEANSATARLDKSAGYPLTYYRKWIHLDRDESTSFHGGALVINIMVCGTLVLLVLGAGYWTRLPSETAQLSIRDLMFVTFLTALPFGLWQVSATKSKNHRHLAAKLGSQGFVVVDGRVAALFAKVLPTSITNASARIREVHLDNPGDATVDEALALGELESLRLGGETYALHKLDPMRKMSQLMAVRIGGRKINDSVLHTIASMPQIRDLSFLRTNMDAQGLKRLGDLPNLDRLNLVDTKVRMQDLQETYPWSTHLVSLELPRPRQGISDTLTLAQWPRLQELTIRSCSRMMNERPVKLRLENLPNLQRITLDSMQAFELSIINAAQLTQLDHDNYFFQSRTTRFQPAPEAAWITKLHIEESPQLAQARIYGRNLKEVFYTGTPQLTFRADRKCCYFSGGVGDVEIESPEIVQNWIEGLGKSHGPPILDLQKLPLHGVDLSPLENNKLIRSLDLTFSSMTDATLESIEKLPQLRDLQLGFGSVDPEAVNRLLQKLPRLERLGTGRLTDACLSLHDHPELKELRNNDPHTRQYYEPIPADTWVCRDVNLSHLTQLEGSIKLMHPLQSLRVKNLPQLTELIAMQTVQIAELEGLSGLQKIGVGGVSVTDADVLWMDQCPTLTHVSLPYTRVTDSSLRSLAKLQSLTHLSIPGTNVTDEVITKLKLDQLVRVNLRDTNVTAKGIRHILQAPHLETLLFNCPGLTADELVAGIQSNQIAVLSMPHVSITASQVTALLKKAPRLLDLQFVGVDVGADVTDAIQGASVLQVLRVSEGLLDVNGLLRLSETAPGLRFDIQAADIPTQTYLQLFNSGRTLQEANPMQLMGILEPPLVDEDALRSVFFSNRQQNL